MISDLRFAVRQLLKSPGFTLLALITLALGIGLNTAIFSLINDLFLRPLPFKEAQRVLHLYSNAKDRNLLELPISAPRYQHYRDGQTIFDGLGGENILAFTLTGLGDPVQLFGGKVTSNYFDVLGVRPIRGRNFLPQEEDTADVTMVTGNLRPAFATLLAAVAFVLLIACSNVANLLLVRFSGRRREIALRMALGASRASVLQLFIFESLLVSILAGLVGAGLAWQLVPFVPKMAANFLPFDPETGVSLSLPVLGFTIVVSIVTGVAMGIYPALQSSRTDLVDGLK